MLGVENLPLPRPLYEIFVSSSPDVEGLHLRFGQVARGGLRWSDRPMDFRTEILGLVKAQQVKNTVIVPVGAKGGFVPKLLPPASDRDAWFAEGTRAYRIFINALLDVTDTIRDGKIIPPADTVRHDGDDPYLVVAADKGTATFSDTANGISEARGHWLGDAFASGGSAGYDHKKMAITARGGWEAVKRHFREMDIDIHDNRSRCGRWRHVRRRLSAMACCFRRRSSLWQPLTIATSSSIRTRTRNPRSTSASAFSINRVRAGRITMRS